MQRHVVILENPTGCYFDERFGYASRLQKKERSKRLIIDLRESLLQVKVMARINVAPRRRPNSPQYQY
jgi:hypothetical protein